MSLAPPETVRKLQAALHAKAKGAPTYRFYALYDKMCRRDVLTYAYERCRQNAGAPGVDGQTFEASGAGQWLDALMQSLRDRTYRPSPIRRVFIPKPDGKQRPLGIGTIRDRVVQMAMVVVLESIFEADLPPEQYAYRPGRSAHDALRHVHALVNAGYTEVVDADLSGYFDSIPHPELMKSVARRVSDRHVLALIKAWLEAPVEEADRRGRVQRTTRNRDACVEALVNVERQTWDSEFAAHVGCGAAPAHGVEDQSWLEVGEQVLDEVAAAVARPLAVAVLTGTMEVVKAGQVRYGARVLGRDWQSSIDRLADLVVSNCRCNPLETSCVKGID